jgi:peptide-methionine (S)-S-oxide reductase
MDAVFTRLEGVLEVKSGYMGGRIPYPTYERICSGVSGYIEIVEVAYDPTVIGYETLLDVFFSSHDPTTRDRQGSDSGEQYRSVIFATGDDLDRARIYREKLVEDQIFDSPIVTEVREKEIFYIAEDYHQDYYTNNPIKPYCSYVIDPKIAKLREKFAKYLKK